MSRDKLQASEESKKMLRAELVTLNDELKQSNEKNEKYLIQIKEFMDKEKKFEAEKEEYIQVSQYCFVFQNFNMRLRVLVGLKQLKCVFLAHYEMSLST